MIRWKNEEIECAGPCTFSANPGDMMNLVTGGGLSNFNLSKKDLFDPVNEIMGKDFK